MIARLHNPSIASTLFSMERLPEAVHGPVLETIMTPIVHSESMIPTIQKGDKLELEETTDLRVGDVVVYRHDRLFICHRVYHIEGRRVSLRGDANFGPLDDVNIQCVVGRVGFLFRDGKRLAVPSSTHRPVPRGDSARSQVFTRGRALVRSLIRRFITWILDLPSIKRVVRIGLRRFMTIEIMERAPLHSLEGYLSRRRLRLDELVHHQYDALSLERDDILLIVHLGPVYLGTCTLATWSTRLRPFLQDSVSDLLFESLEPVRSAHASCLSTQRSTTDPGRQ